MSVLTIAWSMAAAVCLAIASFSLSETFDVGIDAGTPVSNKYRITNHFPFTGELNKVVVRLTE